MHSGNLHFTSLKVGNNHIADTENVPHQIQSAVGSRCNRQFSAVQVDIGIEVKMQAVRRCGLNQNGGCPSSYQLRRKLVGVSISLHDKIARKIDGIALNLIAASFDGDRGGLEPQHVVD